MVAVVIMPNRWEPGKEGKGKFWMDARPNKKIEGEGKSMPSKGDGYGSRPR